MFSNEYWANLHFDLILIFEHSSCGLSTDVSFIKRTQLSDSKSYINSKYLSALEWGCVEGGCEALTSGLTAPSTPIQQGLAADDAECPRVLYSPLIHMLIRSHRCLQLVDITAKTKALAWYDNGQAIPVANS